jgi:hypothetical protein
MFKKLDFTLDIDFDRIKNDQKMEAYGQSFTGYVIKDIEYFNDVVSRSIKFNIKPYSINYTEISRGIVAPHIDGSVITLNYYLQTNGDATLFWKPTASEIKIVPPIQGLTGGPIHDKSTVIGYDPSDLKLVNYFVAKNAEAYLLDASEIHSISPKDYNSVRRIIRFFWEKTTFDEVLNSIEILPK